MGPHPSCQKRPRVALPAPDAGRSAPENVRTALPNAAPAGSRQRSGPRHRATWGHAGSPKLCPPRAGFRYAQAPRGHGQAGTLRCPTPRPNAALLGQLPASDTRQAPRSPCGHRPSSGAPDSRAAWASGQDVDTGGDRWSVMPPSHREAYRPGPQAHGPASPRQPTPAHATTWSRAQPR